MTLILCNGTPRIRTLIHIELVSHHANAADATTAQRGVPLQALQARAPTDDPSSRHHCCPTLSAPQQHLRVWGTRWRGRREQLHQWTAVEQVELENP